MNKPKKILGLVFSGVLLATGFMFAGVSVNKTSLSELSAKAGGCVIAPLYLWVFRNG